MTDYENRPVPEGINYSLDNPLKDFALLMLVALGGLAALLLLLAALANYMAPLIPFSVEQRLAQRMASQFPDVALTQSQAEKQDYLRKLSTSLLQDVELPDGLNVTVHYVPGDTVNAFATLGGNIYVFDGLLRKMPSENALAMVVAHEVAHILHRDPIIAMGRGLTVSLALASIAGVANSSGMDWLFQKMGLVTVMSFTREQEREADGRALDMLQAHFGNVSGAESIFAVFVGEGRDGEAPAFLSTHPLSVERIARIEVFADSQPQRGEPIQLPEFTKEPEEDAP
ncbi:MAG: putative Zn-dependent protease [Bacteroidia bacterium]